jgi:hypothetical protein
LSSILSITRIKEVEISKWCSIRGGSIPHDLKTGSQSSVSLPLIQMHYLTN